jgi:hypothetical protein
MCKAPADAGAFCLLVGRGRWARAVPRVLSLSGLCQRRRRQAALMLKTIATRPETLAGSIIAPVSEFFRCGHRESLKLQHAETGNVFRMLRLRGREHFDFGDMSRGACEGNVSVNERCQRNAAKGHCKAHRKHQRFRRHNPTPTRLDRRQRSAAGIVPARAVKGMQRGRFDTNFIASASRFFQSPGEAGGPNLLKSLCSRRARTQNTVLCSASSSYERLFVRFDPAD